MRGLIAGVLWLTFILLVCCCSSKTIPQTDTQSIGTEVPQNIAVEEQPPTPVEPPAEDEQIQIDANNEDINTPAKDNSPYPFPDKWGGEKFIPDVLSVDYQTGYVKGYNDGCRGYDSWPKNISSPNSLAGYEKGYSKGYAEWTAQKKSEYMRKKYPIR
jgi:hypothetical protein